MYLHSLAAAKFQRQLDSGLVGDSERHNDGLRVLKYNSNFLQGLDLDLSFFSVELDLGESALVSPMGGVTTFAGTCPGREFPLPRHLGTRLLN